MARLETQPVIEQANGIIMVHYRGSPDEALDRLRRISQQHNIRVRDLAADILWQATHPGPRHLRRVAHSNR